MVFEPKFKDSDIKWKDSDVLWDRDAITLRLYLTTTGLDSVIKWEKSSSAAADAVIFFASAVCSETETMTALPRDKEIFAFPRDKEIMAGGRIKEIYKQ